MRRTSTAKPPRSGEQQEGQETPASAWGSLSVHQQTERLVPLIGKQVRYIKRSELTEGRNLFGPSYPLPWRQAILTRLEEVNFKPGVVLTTYRFGDIWKALFGGKPDEVNHTDFAFSDLDTIEAVPTPFLAHEPQEPALEKVGKAKLAGAMISTKTEPDHDYDGDQTYTATQAPCPYCGHAVDVVIRTTLAKTADDLLAD